MLKTNSLDFKEVATAAMDSVAAAKQAAGQAARTVAETISGMKNQSAETLQSGAGSVRSAASHGATVITSAGEHIAGGLESASAYVKNCEVPSLTGSLRRAVANYPAASLALAVSAGFCAGVSMSRARVSRSQLRKEGL